MEYTVEQLQQIKKQAFQDAITVSEDGSPSKVQILYLIGRYLGESTNAKWGPKYRFVRDNCEIFIDDYGHFMTVKVDDKYVCHTHGNENLFVNGPWFDDLAPLLLDAVRERDARKQAQDQKESQQLMEQLQIK